MLTKRPCISYLWILWTLRRGSPHTLLTFHIYTNILLSAMVAWFIILATDFTANQCIKTISKPVPRPQHRSMSCAKKSVVSSKGVKYICKKLNIPKISRKNKVIALLKPGTKTPHIPKISAPFYTVVFFFKYFERLVVNRIWAYVDDKLNKEQTGSRTGKSYCD